MPAFWGSNRAWGAIVWAHAVHNVPFVVLVVMARLSTLPKSQIEAARDRAPTPMNHLSSGITLPYPLVAASWRVDLHACFSVPTISSGRSSRAGYEPTLRLLILAKLRSGHEPRNQLPSREPWPWF